MILKIDWGGELGLKTGIARLEKLPNTVI